MLRAGVVIAVLTTSVASTSLAKADFNRDIERFHSLTKAGSGRDVGWGIWKLSGRGDCLAIIKHTRGSSDNVERIDFGTIKLKSIESMSPGNPNVAFSFVCRLSGCMRVFDTDENPLDPQDKDQELFVVEQRNLTRAVGLIRAVGEACGFEVPSIKIY